MFLKCCRNPIVLLFFFLSCGSFRMFGSDRTASDLHLVQVEPTWTRVALFAEPSGIVSTDSVAGSHDIRSAIRDIHRTRDGSLWVATHGSGVWRQRGTTWEQFSYKDDCLGSPYAETVLEAEDGSIWVMYDAGADDSSTSSGYTSGISHFRNGKWSHFSIEPPDRNKLFSVKTAMIAKDQSLWVGSTQGVFRLRDDKWTVILQISDFQKLILADDGSAWVQTEYKVWHYDSAKIDGSILCDSAISSCILKSTDDSIWLSPNTLIQWQNGKYIEWPEIVDRWKQDLVWPLLALRSGAVWFESLRKGLALFANREWKYFSYNSIDPRSAQLNLGPTMMEAADGSTWMILNNAVFQYANGRWEEIVKADSMGQEFDAYRLVESRNDAIWVVGFGGLGRISNRQFTVVHSPKNLDAKSEFLAHVCLPDANQVTWFGSPDGVLLKFSPSRGKLVLGKSELEFGVAELRLEVEAGRRNPTDWTLSFRLGGPGETGTRNYQHASLEDDFVAFIRVPEILGKEVQLEAYAQDRDGTILRLGGSSSASVKLTIKSAQPIPSGEFAIDAEIAAELRSNAVSVNGSKMQSTKEGTVTFLGDPPKDGLNTLQTKHRELLAWLEDRKLTTFNRPYQKSYAVIVAIDDYARRKDPKHRGATGFAPLGQMVASAEKLKLTLMKLGFGADNIVTLYDEKAESDAINAVLLSFWPGNQRGDADRVFFYFGGHGSSHDNNGFLVTYDYDRSRPTVTSLLMKDLTGRHSDNIEARHFLIALDACSSGLALTTLGGSSANDKVERKSPRQLSIIRNDTKSKARNVLVAGTGDQKAVYDNGGIFTQALIRGLDGEGDLNRDGIIQFVELGLFVKDEVAFAASRSGVEQTAEYYKLTRGGATGEIVFIKEGKQ